MPPKPTFRGEAVRPYLFWLKGNHRYPSNNTSGYPCEDGKAGAIPRHLSWGARVPKYRLITHQADDNWSVYEFWSVDDDAAVAFSLGHRTTSRSELAEGLVG